MRYRYRLFPIAVLWLVLAGSASAEQLTISPEKIAGGEPAAMMQAYWLEQVDEATERWKADYEKRKTPEEIDAYQQQMREKFLEAIGGLPERTPRSAAGHSCQRPR